MSADLDPESIAKLLATQLQDLEKSHKKLAKSGLPDDEVVKLRKDLAIAIVDVSKEARAWQKQNTELGLKLGMHQKIELMIQFIGKLQPADRLDFFAKLRTAGLLP